jgi:hypothetical protein
LQIENAQNHERVVGQPTGKLCQQQKIKPFGHVRTIHSQGFSNAAVIRLARRLFVSNHPALE